MNASMSMADAVVTIKSLPRRFGEIINGISGDDDWNRLVRVPDMADRSALGWTAHTSALLTALGTMVAQIPLQAKPVLDTTTLNPPSTQARLGTIAEVLAELKSASTRAADAIDARSHDDVDRECTVNGETMRACDAINAVVKTCVAQLGDAADALAAAGASQSNRNDDE
jgi:hypothetical protein